MERRIRIVVLLAAGLLAACGGAPEPEPEPVAEPAAVVVDRYTLRGEVTALPDETEPARIYILHEAIPTFRMNGETVGMDSMTMPFTLAPGVSSEGLTVGTKVELDWEISEDAPAGVVVRLEALPGDTVLELRRPLREDG